MAGKTLTLLLKEARACTVCAPHLPHGVRPVLQAGRKARILVAGQAPGRKVHASGVPFDDASGERLRTWMGLDSAQFYDPNLVALLPMGFCYPGTGASGDLPPRPECAAHWRAPMLAALPNIELTLLLGQHAVAWHVPELARRPLTDVVVAWQDHWPSVLPLPHPSPRNNIWLKRNAWFEEQVVPALQARVREVLTGMKAQIPAGPPQGNLRPPWGAASYTQ